MISFPFPYLEPLLVLHYTTKYDNATSLDLAAIFHTVSGARFQRIIWECLSWLMSDRDFIVKDKSQRDYCQCPSLIVRILAIAIVHEIVL